MINIHFNKDILLFFKKYLKLKFAESVSFDEEKKYLFLYYNGPVYVRINIEEHYENISCELCENSYNAQIIYKAIKAIKDVNCTLNIEQNKISIKEKSTLLDLKANTVTKRAINTCFKKFFIQDQYIYFSKKFILSILDDICSFVSKVDHVDNFLTYDNVNNLNILITDRFIFFDIFITTSSPNIYNTQTNHCVSLSKNQFFSMRDILNLINEESVYINFDKKYPLNFGNSNNTGIILHSTLDNTILHSAKAILSKEFVTRIIIKDALTFKTTITSIETITRAFSKNLISDVTIGLNSKNNLKIETKDCSYLENLNVDVEGDNSCFNIVISTICLFRIASFKSLFQNSLYIDFLGKNQPILLKCFLEDQSVITLGLMSKCDN